MKIYKSGIYITVLIYLSCANFITGQNSSVTLTTTTAAPALTTTMPPQTSNNETEVEPIVYYICGDNKLPEGVSCYCYKNSFTCYSYTWRAESLQNLNIKVLIANFTVVNARIDDQKIKILKKNDTLPAIAKEIQSLSLQSNGISDIENGTFDKFDKLESLALKDNFLKNLSVGVLTQKLGSTLKELNLYDNNLKLSAIDFTYMTQLQILDLGANHNVGKLFANSSWAFPKSLSNLKTLNLWFCSITTITDNIFANLINLESLSLFGNSLTVYPKPLNNLLALRYLDLSNNAFSELNQTVMGVNEHLNDLIIQNSQITTISDCAFCGFSNLTTLHLYRNRKLSFIDANAFGYAKNVSTPKIESFSVEYCNLSIIPEKLLNWHSVKEFGVAGNPFNCSCEMSWFIDDIMSPTHTMNLKRIAPFYAEKPLQCKSPVKYRNLEFYKLTPNYCPQKYHLVKPSESSFAVGFLIFLCIVLIVVVAVPLCKYLLCLQKQKTLFSYAESRVNEDFDSNA